jgi:hypothetical protein
MDRVLSILHGIVLGAYAAKRDNNRLEVPLLRLVDLMASRYGQVFADIITGANGIPRIPTRDSVKRLAFELGRAKVAKDPQIVEFASILGACANYLVPQELRLTAERTLSGSVPHRGVPTIRLGKLASTPIKQANIQKAVAAARAKASTDTSSDRILDVKLAGGPPTPGELITLLIVIRLASSPLEGQFSKRVHIDPSGGPIDVTIDCAGFRVIPPVPKGIRLPAAADTEEQAVTLQVLEGTKRWITILLWQAGRQVADLTITDFGEPPSRRSMLPMIADLSVIIRQSDSHLEGYSPSDVLSLNGVDLGLLKQPMEQPIRMLSAALQGLYDNTATPEATERKLQILGVELTNSLPEAFVDSISSGKVKTLMLQHEVSLDFPLELCFIQRGGDSFFVGDRIAVCRWYLGVRSLPEMTRKVVKKVAMLKGDTEASADDERTLSGTFSMPPVAISSKSQAVQQVFKTREFDALHFIGHCTSDEDGAGYLKLEEDLLPVMEIGQLDSESTFGEAQPFVMLNGCGTGKPYISLSGKDSLPHRFVKRQACGFVGTLWPVDQAAASRFALVFYGKLRKGTPISKALIETKSVMLGKEPDEHEPPLDELGKIACLLAARSYCLYANPDLQVRSK